MDQATSSIISAVITGVVVLASAVVAAVAARSEPRRVKELKALTEIIERMPPGEERRALDQHRRKVALRVAGKRTVADWRWLGLYWAGGAVLVILIITTLLSNLRSDPSKVISDFYVWGLAGVGVVAVGVFFAGMVGFLAIFLSETWDEWKTFKRVRAEAADVADSDAVEEPAT
jgi:uncharacterized membrane protein YccC